MRVADLHGQALVVAGEMSVTQCVHTYTQCVLLSSARIEILPCTIPNFEEIKISLFVSG